MKYNLFISCNIFEQNNIIACNLWFVFNNNNFISYHKPADKPVHPIIEGNGYIEPENIRVHATIQQKSPDNQGELEQILTYNHNQHVLNQNEQEIIENHIPEESEQWIADNYEPGHMEQSVFDNHEPNPPDEEAVEKCKTVQPNQDAANSHDSYQFYQGVVGVSEKTDQGVLDNHSSYHTDLEVSETHEPGQSVAEHSETYKHDQRIIENSKRNQRCQRVFDNQVSDQAEQGIVDNQLSDQPEEGIIDQHISDQLDVDKQESDQLEHGIVDNQVSDQLDKGIVNQQLSDQLDKGIVDNQVSAQPDTGIVDKQVSDQPDTGIVDKQVLVQPKHGIVEKQVSDQLDRGIVHNQISDQLDKGIFHNQVSDQSEQGIVEHYDAEQTDQRVFHNNESSLNYEEVVDNHETIQLDDGVVCAPERVFVDNQESFKTDLEPFQIHQRVATNNEVYKHDQHIVDNPALDQIYPRNMHTLISDQTALGIVVNYEADQMDQSVIDQNKSSIPDEEIVDKGIIDNPKPCDVALELSETHQPGQIHERAAANHDTYHHEQETVDNCKANHPDEEAAYKHKTVQHDIGVAESQLEQQEIIGGHKQDTIYQGLVEPDQIDHDVYDNDETDQIEYITFDDHQESDNQEPSMPGQDQARDEATEHHKKIQQNKLILNSIKTILPELFADDLFLEVDDIGKEKINILLYEFVRIQLNVVGIEVDGSECSDQN